MKIFSKKKTVVINDDTYECEGCHKVYKREYEAKACEGRCLCPHIKTEYRTREICWDKPTYEYGITKCCVKCDTEIGPTKVYLFYEPTVAELIYNNIPPSR